MLNVKVLGPGCANCKRLEQMTRSVIDQMQADITLEKITNYGDIMAYGVMSTPALVINEQVVSYGRIPSKDEINTWLVNAQEIA